MGPQPTTKVPNELKKHMKAPHPLFITKHFILIPVLAVALVISQSILLADDTNEVWISARIDGVGLDQYWGNGTITAPFYGDFDYIINSLPTNTTIHLLPGIHH